ncbi:MAG TPA: SCO family protein [Bacteroidales bacterium]|nr:SCO family protein [Bacteroidales bacterium]
MKKLFILIFLTIPFSLFAQQNMNLATDTSEVGVIEHLGATIPLDLRFVNDTGDTVALASLVDKPTIFSFVYFDCPGICSPLLNGVSEVIEKTDMELGKDYQVITISFNYNDSPEKAHIKKENFLKKHSKTHAGHWIYLTGDSINIYKATDAFGFKFRRVGLDYIHPASIMVVSPKGKITRYLYGVTFLPFDVKMALVEAQKGLARPTINRVLEYCFTYDPVGRRYAVDVLKVSATIIIFFIAVFVGALLIKSRIRSKNERVVQKLP